MSVVSLPHYNKLLLRWDTFKNSRPNPWCGPQLRRGYIPVRPYVALIITRFFLVLESQTL
jgi:hypothetical protein